MYECSELKKEANKSEEKTLEFEAVRALATKFCKVKRAKTER